MGNHESIPKSRGLALKPVNIRAQNIVYLASLDLAKTSISGHIEDIRRNGVFHSECIGGFVWRHIQGTHGFDPPVFPAPDTYPDQ